MKRFPLLHCTLLFSGFASAAPILDTFSGSVINVDDFEGVIAEIYPANDFSGMPITCVISVDHDRHRNSVPKRSRSASSFWLIKHLSIDRIKTSSTTVKPGYRYRAVE